MHQIEPLQFAESGDLSISPSAHSSPHDFDFLIGKWQVNNRKLNTRLDKCTEWIEFTAYGEMRKILNGIGNIDNFHTNFDGQPVEGMALRLFDPATKLWSIYWADSNLGKLDTPVIGSFENTTGLFYARDIYQGKDIIFLFHWDASDPDHPVWSQAFSADKGNNWEWNWYMYMSRNDADPEGFPEDPEIIDALDQPI